MILLKTNQSEAVGTVAFCIFMCTGSGSDLHDEDENGGGSVESAGTCDPGRQYKRAAAGSCLVRALHS